MTGWCVPIKPIKTESQWRYIVRDMPLIRVAAHHWVMANGVPTAGVVPPYSVSWLPSVPIIIDTSSTWDLAVFAALPDMTKGHEATLINKNKVRNTLMLSKIWLGLSYK